MLRAAAALLLAFAALGLAGQASQSQTPAAAEETYTCPMHLEVRSVTPGTCPRCGMALVPAAPAVPADFDLLMETTPKLVKPGVKTRLSFTVINPATREPARQFGVLHDRLFHLFVVSQDLTQFQHIHPVLEEDGRFVIDAVLPRAGQYKVYADLYPLEGAPQVLQKSLATAGSSSDLFAATPHLEPDAELVKTVSGMKVALALDPVEPFAGRPLTLRYTLSDAATGAPVRDLVPYLAAWGHTLILSEDQVDYVHSHPVEAIPETKPGEQPRGGPEVTFEALLPAPGVYRIWSQFLRAGHDESGLVTVSFTIRARTIGVR